MPILRRAALSIIALAVALVILVQVQQRLLRYRAERLHAEIVALQLHPATFADIQRMQREWGGHARYAGPCDEHHCIYQIRFRDAYLRASDAVLERGSYDNRYLWQALSWLSLAYRTVGGRPVSILADIRVHDNQIWVRTSP